MPMVKARWFQSRPLKSGMSRSVNLPAHTAEQSEREISELRSPCGGKSTSTASPRRGGQRGGSGAYQGAP